MRINQGAAERIERDGVKGEVAPRRRVGIAQRRIGRDGEAAVAGAGFRFTSRQGKIVLGAARRAPDLDHAKAAADDIGGAKGRQRTVQGLEIDTAHLDIEILRGESEQPVAHAAADQPWPAHAANRVKHRPQVPGKLEFAAHSSLAIAAAITQAQPAMNAMPPSGVTGPSHRGPPRAKP